MTFLWKMCLELGIIFSQDVVLTCVEIDGKPVVWKITEPHYSKLSWDDNNEARRPQMIVSSALRSSPRARIFLLKYVLHPSPETVRPPKQTQVLKKLLEDPELRRLLAQEDREIIVLGNIYSQGIVPYPADSGTRLLKSLMT